MWKLFVAGYLVTQIMICGVSSKAIEIIDSDEKEETTTNEPVEIPIKIGPIKSSSGDTFSVFKEDDDPFLSFLNNMVNMSYISSQVALNRMKDHSDRVRKIRGQMENLLEKLPSFPIPILDDIPRVRLFS